VIDLLTSMISSAERVILAAISVAATVYVAAIWWRTKALVPTMTAVVMAGVVLYAVNNVDALKDGVEADSHDWIDVGGNGGS
jgi:hypothetical protein